MQRVSDQDWIKSGLHIYDCCIINERTRARSSHVGTKKLAGEERAMVVSPIVSSDLHTN